MAKYPTKTYQTLGGRGHELTAPDLSAYELATKLEVAKAMTKVALRIIDDTALNIPRRRDYVGMPQMNNTRAVRDRKMRDKDIGHDIPLKGRKGTLTQRAKYRINGRSASLAIGGGVVVEADKPAMNLLPPDGYTNVVEGLRRRHYSNTKRGRGYRLFGVSQDALSMWKTEIQAAIRRTKVG